MCREVLSQLDVRKWTWRALKVPQQRNSHDCGPFLCYFAKSLALVHRPTGITQMTYFRKYLLRELLLSRVYPWPYLDFTFCFYSSITFFVFTYDFWKCSALGISPLCNCDKKVYIQKHCNLHGNVQQLISQKISIWFFQCLFSNTNSYLSITKNTPDTIQQYYCLFYEKTKIIKKKYISDEN